MSAVHRAAVLGHPIAHSLSPVLHRAAYTALGLDGWRYDAIDTTVEQLPGFLDGLDGTWAGLSLTMPLKVSVRDLVDHVEPLADVVGAINTVLVQPGPRLTLVGANTDVHGIVAALQEGGIRPGGRTVGRAVVLGGGATAASALAALAQLGQAEADVLVRSVARAGGMIRAAHRMGVSPRTAALGDPDAAVGRWVAADTVVSTLPPHAADPMAEALVRRGEPVSGVLLDCAYDPRVTALGAAWRSLGGTVVAGERMLLHQATEQVRLMTGRAAPVEAMAAALDGALGAAPAGPRSPDRGVHAVSDARTTQIDHLP
ncbi:shikimate dehydrogenase [Actinotalea sp. M2MS4P-6]|uniref:shikimate dehydrogenase n=1 Tax=Actinotalea sp. M2MS4P-6 TaxID=2983762 RepID=UPI0021E3FADB|nr:shikimate dehydrogenase [Actinotalea sp. M2MS4P-6]MCV2394570.1 shikimate dehydrogenase [Actinotalea sp. M2MS4P-6]